MIIWSANRSVDISTPVDLLKRREDSIDSIGNYHSSYFIEPSSRPETDYLGDFYTNLCDEICYDLFLKGKAELRYETWMQVYTNRSKTFLKHDHFSGNEFLSWIHFVDVGLEKCFHFVAPDGRKHYPKQNKGDIIVFPSWIDHAADPPSDGERVIVAGNIEAQRVYRDTSETTYSELQFHFFADRFGMWEICFDEFEK